MTDAPIVPPTEPLLERLAAQDLSEAARRVLASEEATDVIEDLHQRMLTGSMLDPDEAEEFMAEGLEDTAAAPEDEEELEEVTAELSRALARDCGSLWRSWEGQETDVRRLFRAFNTLIDDKDISCGLFTDWPSLELTDEERGGVLVWVNAWEDLSPFEERELMIGYVGQTASDEEVGRDLFDALVGAGLRPQEPVDGSVIVPVLWRLPNDLDDEDFEDDDEEDDDEDDADEDGED